MSNPVVTRPTRCRTRGAVVVPIVVGVGLALVPAVGVDATHAAPSAPGATTVERPASPAAVKAANRITRKLQKRVNARAFGRDVSVRVWDPTTGRTLFRKRAGAAQLPASNMKLVTAATTLWTVGGDTRLPTRVTRVEGRGGKSIAIVGGGDPMLSRTDVTRLARRTAAALRAEGRTSVHVFLDDSLFAAPTAAKGWRSNYVGRYVMPVRALSFLGTRSSDTSRVVQQHFAAALRANGVSARVRGRATADLSAPVARFRGNLVSSAVDRMLEDSDNQVAETLYRQVAVASGRKATWAGGRRAARAALEELGVPVARLRLVDGSGLSRSNRLTTNALVRLLRAADTRPELAGLAGGLPVAGSTGTLKRRYTSHPTSCARGRVLAKTGYIDGVVALSGYAVGVDGRTRMFSVLANYRHGSRPVSSVQAAVDRVAATVVGCH